MRLALGGKTLFFKGILVLLWSGFPTGLMSADLLLVSNHPERLSEPASLLMYQVPSGKTLRLLYHHKNVTTIPLRFVITAKSVAGIGKMATLLAVAGPVSDEVFVGHKAVERYWEQLPQRKPDMPIDTRETPLLDVMLKPGEIVSGIFECKSDVETLFDVRVVDPVYEDASYALMARQLTPMVYPTPTIVQDVVYRVGDVIEEISIGGMPFVLNPALQNPLKGNYGVTYKIHAALENPDPVARKVSLLFAPLGGVARAIVRLNGTQLLKTGNVGGTGFPTVVEMMHVILPPQSKKNVVLEVMPQSGSYYPIHLVLRSEGPSTMSGTLTSVVEESNSEAMPRMVLQEVVNNGY